jgi:hypothetical protein
MRDHSWAPFPTLYRQRATLLIYIQISHLTIVTQGALSHLVGPTTRKVMKNATDLTALATAIKACLASTGSPATSLPFLLVPRILSNPAEPSLQPQ